jgi:hypothetical protein
MKGLTFCVMSYSPYDIKRTKGGQSNKHQDSIAGETLKEDNKKNTGGN